MSKKYISIQDNRMGEHTLNVCEFKKNMILKFDKAIEENDHLFFLNLEASLNSNVEQMKVNVYNFFKQDYPEVNRRFGSSSEFKFTVPINYNSDNQLALFSSKYQKNFNSYNEFINDKNFSRVSTKLLPGKTYIVKIFSIFHSVNTEDCIAFLKRQNALLTGCQGLSLLYQENKKKFYPGKFIVSFDNDENLWNSGTGDYKVPYIYFGLRGGRAFKLGNFESLWTSDYSFIGFFNCR